MEVSSLEDILTAPNLNNCFQAEDEDKGNGSSAQFNNAFTLQGCADENENEVFQEHPNLSTVTHFDTQAC